MERTKERGGRYNFFPERSFKITNMADAAVQFLVGSIGSLLQKEAASLGAVRGEINELKLELESTRSFLKDADEFKDDSEGLRLWVTQVRDIAYKAENIIDEFMYHMGGQLNRGGGFRSFLGRVVHLPKELLVKHRTAIKLQEISAEIKAIAKRSKRYEFGRIEEGQSSHAAPTSVQNLAESALFINDDDVVGIQKEINSLLKLLIEGEMQRTVISVWGMGGSGKTTLVAKAYNNEAVKRCFDCYAWVTVSQHYVIEDLLRKMIKELFCGRKELVPSSLSSMGYKQLMETLVEFLQQKRYVIVLDDVWDVNFWSQIKLVLLDGRNGSRIILTTRNKDIASYPYGVAHHVIQRNPLEDCDAWILFCKKAFASEPNNHCPPYLKNLAWALVKKCEGLPLAVEAMGGLMASKDKSELKWGAVYDSFNWHLCKDSKLEVVKAILLLSFNGLPYYLKNCFQYCCLFPSNHWISAHKLVRLWMAEGFVEERKGLTPEEVAKGYLKELISRSLLQVTRKNNTFLRPKLCKLHDLMRELALSVYEQDHFCSIYDPQGIKDERIARRFSIHTFDHAILQLCSTDMSRVRSFFAFHFDKCHTFPLDPFLSGFRLLRVLELRGVPIDSVPKTIGKLFNLRYLNLKGTRIRELPKSLGRPGSSEDNGEGTSRGEVFTYMIGVQVPADVLKLKNLQVLTSVEANGDIIRGIGNMTQLKRIGLTKVKEEDQLALCASLQKLKLLRHLLVMVSNEEETLWMDALSSPPPLLRKLTLIGRLNSAPPWFSSLSSIVHLHLHWSRLTEDPIPYINALPKLERLAFVNAYDHGIKKLCFHEGFPKLQHLSVLVSPELVEIIIEKGAMPSLSRISLCVCTKLKKVPLGIEYLTNLQELELKDVSDELVNSIRGEESFDHPRVRHIPVINHYQQTTSFCKFESLS
ncbi:unnamed protein product [Camellia sinensis]